MSINLLMPDPESPGHLARTDSCKYGKAVLDRCDLGRAGLPARGHAAGKPATFPLTVFQSLPIDGIVIVTSPQELVQMIVKKAYNMAKMMNIPVLGVVENFSYLKCPDCGKEIPVFGKSKVDAAAKELGLAVGGKLPIDPS